MNEILENNSQEQIDNQPKQNNQIVPSDTFYDYSLLHEGGLDNATIADQSALMGIPAIMPSYEEFKAARPNYSEQDLTELYNNASRSYQALQTQNYDPERSFLRNFNKLPYSTIYDQLGWPTQPRPDAPSIPMSTEFAVGPGFWNNPLQVSHPDQMAESLGYFMDADGNWKENKRINRIGRFFSRTMNPDPNSPLEYYWKQVGLSDGLISPEAIRTFLGPRNMSTPTMSSLVNARAFLAESVGLTAMATGALIRSLSVLGNKAFNIMPDDSVNDWWITRRSNGLTNIGSYLTHQNMDELDGMFSSLTGFSWGLYGGVGQLMSMVYASKLARLAGASPQASVTGSLLLGSSQAGASFHNSILQNGGTDAEAAAAFFAFGAVTYGANILLSANIAQRLGLKGAGSLMRKNANRIGKAAKEAYQRPISALTPQSKEAVANAMATDTAEKLGKMSLLERTAAGFRSGRGLFGRVSGALENIADYSVQGVPVGFALGMGGEEFIEEALEEAIHTPMERFYNKHFANPRAKEIVRTLSKFRYGVDYDEYGNPIYHKIDQDGKLTVIPWNVWQEEQKDLQASEGILNGEYPLDARFSWEEPFAALISSFVGGIPIFYIGGGHKARKSNDEALYRQNIALEISKHRPERRLKMLGEIETELRRQQKQSGIFGPDYIRPDGTVITEKDAKEGDSSVAEMAIQTFINDLKLDIETVDRFHKDSPNLLIAFRNNQYLYHEAFDVVGKINQVQLALQALEKGEPLTVGSHVQENDTQEILQKRLEGLQKDYEKIVMPKDGRNGKQPSQRYTEIVMDSMYADYLVKPLAEERIEEAWFRQGKKRTENESGFNKAVEREMKKIRESDKDMAVLAWLKSPDKLLKHLPNHHQYSVYGVLDYIYKNMLGQEMQAIGHSYNEQIQSAKKGYENLGGLLESFAKEVEDFQTLDNAKYSGEVDSDAWREFNRFSAQIKSLIDQAMTLSNIARYNELISLEASALTDSFNTLAQKIGKVTSDIELSLDYDAESINRTESEIFPRPGADLVSFYSGLKKTIEEAPVLTQGLPEFERSNEIPFLDKEKKTLDFSKESPELVSRFRKDAYIRFLENVNETNIPQGSERRTVPLSYRITELNEKLSDDNYVIDEEEQRDIIELLENIKSIDGLLSEAADANVNFVQQLSGADAVHSMLEDGKSGHLKFSVAENQEIQDFVNNREAAVEKLLSNKRLESFSRDLEQTRDYVRNLSLKYYFLKDADVFNLKKGNPFGKEFGLAIEELFALIDDKQGDDFFENQFRAYKDDKSPELKVKAELKGKFYEIEKAIIKVEETLSGKLDSYIENIRRNSEAKDFYNNLEELYSSLPIIRGGEGIKGAMTIDGFKNLKDKRELAQNIKYFMLTNAVTINRFGQKPTAAERSFTISEVLQAYREVLKKRNVEGEAPEGYNGTDAIINGPRFNATTYSQEQLVLQIAGFIINHGSSALLHPEKSYAELLQKSIYVRGFAGTGKTSQVMIDTISVIEELTGKKQFITVVVPTAALEEEHGKNFKLLNKISGKDFDIIYNYELTSGEKSAKGIVIVDEASIWSSDMLEDNAAILGQNLTLWLGDDAQTPPFDDSRTMVEPPIKNVAAERTMPITEVFRSGNKQIHSIQDFFRKMFITGYSANFPTLTYEIDSETGLMKGGIYYKTAEDLRDNFIKQFELLPEDKRHVGEIIYVLPTVQNMNSFLFWVESKYGKEKRELIQPLVFTAEYENIEYNSCVSGMTSERVFFEFDPDVFITDRFSNELGSDVVLGVTKIGGPYNAAISRVGLTGSSRAKSFLALIGNPDKSKQGKVFESTSIKSNSQLIAENDAAIERLVYLTDDKTTYKDDKKDDPPGPDSLDIDRNILVTPEVRKEILKSNDFKKLKESLENLNKQLIEKARTDNKPVVHVSEIAMSAESVGKAEKDPKYANQRQERRLKNNYFVEAIRFLISNDSRHQAAAMAIIGQLNDHYQKVYKDNPNTLEKRVIKMPANFFAKTLLELQLPFDAIQGDELAFAAPTLVSENIKIKLPTGDVSVTNVEGNPAIIRVVGYAKSGKKSIPIIDIEDFVIHNNDSSYTGEAGPYTKAKMAAYVLMAKQSGMRVNKITLNNYVSSGATIQFVGFHTMSDQEVIEGVKETLPNMFVDQEITPEAESVLATQDELVQNEHEVAHEIYKPWHYFVDEKTGDFVRVDRVGRTGRNTNTTHTVYFTKGNKGKKVYSLSEAEFASTYIPIKTSEKFYDGYKHNHRAIVFLEGTEHTRVKNAVQASTLVVPSNIDANGQYLEKVINHPAYKAKESLLGILSTTYNLSINKVYNRTFKNTTYNPNTKKLGYADFDHVVTNELTDAYLSAEIDLVKDILVKAELIKSNSRLGKDKLIAMFKENRFHILGMDNVPEYKFRTKDNNEISLLPFIDKFLAAEPGSVAETEAIKEIKERIEEGFKDDKVYKNQLVTYNLAKVIQLKHVKNNGKVVARIADVEIGNVLQSEEKITATKLIEKLKGKGFILSTAKRSPQRKASGKSFFYIEARRPGYPGSVSIEFDAVAAGIDDVNEYIGELNDVWGNDTRVIDALGEIESILGETEEGKELTAEELRRLKNASMAAKLVLEKTAAYQFLRTNQAALKTIYNELQTIARDSELSLDGEKIKATGNLFYFKGRYGLEIVGNHAKQKYLNLFSVMKAVQAYMMKTKRVADKDVVWRKNPFYVVFDEGGVSLQSTKDDVNPDLIETTVQDIKTPELYTIIDEFSETLQHLVVNLGVNKSDRTEAGNQSNEFGSDPFSDAMNLPTDDESDPLEKRATEGISLENAITIPEAVRQVNNLIGKVNADSVLKIRDFEITNKRDQALFGRMVDGLIELSGYNIDNRIHVQKDSPRHETMHFIMNYMLDYGTHQKVLEGIKKELGDAYVEGDIRQLYEYAAEVFETMTEVTKPKNVFQKLIHNLKRIGVWLGAYRWTFREMLSEANRGYFRNAHVYSVPNYDFDSLEKNKDLDKYADPERLKEVIDKLGGFTLYSYFRDYIVLRNLKSYLPVGKSLLKTGNTVDEAIFRTGKFYQNKRIFVDKTGVKLGDKTHEIDGSFVAVKKMTPSQFLRAKSLGNRQAFEDYVNYQLSFVDNTMLILKDALPDINISKSRWNGSRLYNDNFGNVKSTNNSAAKNIHVDAEQQSMAERMPNIMNLMLGSVPLYEFSGTNVYLDKAKRFVPKRAVEKVFIDSIQRIKSGKSQYVREVVKDFLPDITPELLFDEMEHFALNEVYDNYIKDIYLSVVYEFGDKFVSTVDEKGTKYFSDNGERQLVGYLAIINNPGRFGGDWQQNQTDFSERVVPMRNMLSGIISHFNSLAIRKVGLVNIETGKFETKSNNIKTIVKSNIRDTVRTQVFSDDGFVKDAVAPKITDGNASQVIRVSNNGFDVAIEGRSSLASYKNSNYKKKMRSQSFGMLSGFYASMPNDFETVYDKSKNVKKIDAAAIEKVFHFFGIYNYPKSLLTSAFENKNKDGQYSVFNMLHRMLMATKLNAVMKELIVKEREFVDKLLENDKDAKPYDIFNTIFEKMDSDTQMMYRFIMEKDYGFVNNKGLFAAPNKIDTYYRFEEWNQYIAIPAPADYFDFTEKIAGMIADASVDDVLMTRTAEGENTFAQVPGARVSDMMFGSEVYVGKKIKELSPAFASPELNEIHPLIGEDFRFNNPLLNLKMSFDEAYEFNGITNNFRGKNFRDNTERDLNLAILEAFFADGVLAARAWSRVNLLMTPFADKTKAFVVPVFFHKGGDNYKETESILSIERESGKIIGMKVNESLFVNNFSDIVNYYAKRQEKSLNKFAQTLALTEEKDVNNAAEGKFKVETTSELLAKVKLELEEFRDYIVMREGDKSFIVAGHGVTLDNTIFNRGFIQAWKKSKDVFTKYNLLRSAVSEDFLDWLYRLKKSDALNLLQRSGRNVPVEFFSTFQEVKIEDLVSERGDFSVLEKAGKTLTPEKIGSLVRDKIIAERNNWLSSRYKKDGRRAAKGEKGFEPMTMDDYVKIAPSLADAMYTEMSNDADLRKTINDIRNQDKKLKQKYTKKSVDLMGDVAWPPALEALYMSYLLGNESIAHLERQDITLFDNPGQFIKRGSGLSAPGNVFDLSNPNGISKNTQVAVMEDIAGFNRFLGVDPNDPAGRKMFTDGHSLVNPVWLELLKNSSGGDFGVVGDYANKTVFYGYDILNDKSFYFKFSQVPIDATHYRNSDFHKAFMQKMLGEYYSVFESYLNDTNDFDKAVKFMAEFVTNPINADENGILPREKMIGYVIHSSNFKQGLTGVNQYAYDGEDVKSAYNVRIPESIQSITVPNEFLRLQVVNNGDGKLNLHSFATQLFSILGVGSHNKAYIDAFNDALIYKVDQFTNEIEKIISDAAVDGVDPKERMVAFVKDVIRQNSGRSIKGSKLESLLNNEKIVGEVLGNKAFEGLVSYMNDHLKPSVPGSNYVQQPEFMKVFQNLKTGAVYLSSDLGLENDLQDADGHLRRLLRPLTYFSKDTKLAFESKADLETALSKSPDNVVAVPAEVIMQFHYADHFGIPQGVSLQSIFGWKNGFSFYETGFQRAVGENAKSAADVAELIMAQLGENPTYQQFINAFSGEWMQVKAYQMLRNEARSLIRSGKGKNATISKKEVEELTTQLLSQPLPKESYLIRGISEFYFDLNNALDIISVRIPTTNASSGSIGRIVAFSDTGNSIFTSAEKSILDGSDYDHDELHVFYPSLSGRKINVKKLLAASSEQSQKSLKNYNDSANTNQMFYAIRDFYSDPRNHVYTLAPIDLTSFKDWAKENASSEDSSPNIANSVNHNVYSSMINFAGVNLVGHFANQMAFTNKLISQDAKELAQTVNPRLQGILSEDRYPEILDFIAKLTNAAVDNATLNGLLGQLNINNAVTPLIAGAVLHAIPETVTVKKGKGKTAITEEIQKELEQQVIEMLQDPVVQRAAQKVIASQSLRSKSRQTKIWEALLDHRKSVRKQSLVDKLDRFRSYAHAGEQLNRLGNLYKITQEFEGRKSDAARMLYNIERALGNSIENFIKPSNLQRMQMINFANEKAASDYVLEQIENIKDNYFMKHEQEGDSLGEEFNIRMMINIGRIVANNPLIVSQLRAISAFKTASAATDFSMAHPEIKSALMQRIGRPELLYEAGYNDYENSIKKMLIGTFMQKHGDPNLALQYFNPNNQADEMLMIFDLQDAQEQMRFVIHFSEYVNSLKKRFPDIDFLKRVDFERFGRNPIPVAKFRNSIYIEPGEKAAYRQSFNRLAKEAPEAAKAFRYYQLLVYGFTFRNGTFSEVIDNAIEKEFSAAYSDVEQTIISRFNDPEESYNFLAEIAFNADQILPYYYSEDKILSDFYKMTSFDSSLETMFMKVDPEKTEGKHINKANGVLVNHIFPKELYIMSPGAGITTDFVYRELTKEQLLELHYEGRTNKVSAGNVNARMNPPQENNLIQNIPYSGSTIRTILNDVAKISVKSINRASFTRLRDKDNPAQSRITISGSAVTAHGIDVLMSVMKSRFRGVNFEFVDNQTSMTDGIAYVHRGTVYINKDKIQVDTLFHEITHVLLPLIKEMNPSQYQALYDDAMRMVEENDPVVDLIRNKYKSLSDRDLLEEIIATVTGWTTMEKVEEYLAIHNMPWYKRGATYYWNRFKSGIKNFWNSVRSIFKGYQLNIDPETATIRDFAADIVSRALSGQNVLKINSLQLKNLSRTAYEQVYEQRTEPISSSRDLYDHLMNTGEIKQGDHTVSIKQYRDLDRDEKIQEFIDKIPQKKFVHMTRSGEVIRFDPKRPETWRAIVEEKVLGETDTNALEIKRKVLSAFARKDFSPTVLQNSFGITESGHPRISDKAIDKFLRQVRYHPKHKFMLYSELPGTKYEYMYDEALVGFNPIVNIEYESEDQIIVSLFNITNDSIFSRDKLAPYEKRNILNRYYTDGMASRRNITMKSNVGDASNLLLGLIAGKISDTNKKVYIHQAGTISLNPKDSHIDLMFGIDLKKNIEAMLDSHEFRAELDSNILSYLEKFTAISQGFDYQSVLFNKYEEMNYGKAEIEAFKNGSLDYHGKKRVFMSRLAELSKRAAESGLSVDEALEIDLLFKAVGNYNGSLHISDQINSKSDLNAFEKYASPQFDVGHELIDVIRRATIQTSQQTVTQIKKFKDEIDEFAEFFRARYIQRHGAIDERIRDVTGLYYNDLLAKVTDRNGVKRFAGNILWTTDKELDPLFYEQARQLEPEVLKWGEFIVNQITDQMIDNFMHKRIREHGRYVRKNDQLVEYTREMAEKDLYIHTTYKKGMLPLMQDTVGQLISKGKIGKAWKTKRSQIESSFVEFEEIGNLSDKEAEALDAMPDMFMAQFANTLQEFEVGSLGLTDKRMYKFLGLVEDKGEYLYDEVSDRGSNINTDLETLMEFFKLSSLRKINYENNVLPLINGAKVYMTDLQTNQEFKQKNALEYLDLFVNQSILGKRKKTNLNVGGVNVEPLVLAAMGVASPLVMAGNINVMAVSAIHNFMMTFIEGTINTIYDAMNPEEKRHWATVKEFTQASGLVFTDFHKVSQLMRDFQLINPNEYEMVVHRYNQKRKKHVFSDYHAQWMNWSADYYARGVVMVAQMLKDGSYYAYSYNRSTGKADYDPKKDRQYFDSNGNQDKKQEVLYSALKERLQNQDIGLNEKGEASVGYSYEQMRAFKGFADKYIVGAYGPLEKNIMTQFLLGRMAMMFTTWFMTKVSNAFKSGSWLDEVGYFDIQEDGNGNMIPYWQREWTEGYLTTVLKMTFSLIRDGDVKQFKNMKPHEKYNWIKSVVTTGTFLSGYLMYAFMFGIWEDRLKWLKDEEEGEEVAYFWKEKLEETRFRKNILYAISSLSVWATILEKLDSPFAVTGILRRMFTQGLTLSGAKWENLKYVLPFANGFFTTRDEVRAYLNNDD